MAKTDSKRLNIRIRQEVAWTLEELARRDGISQTEVIERAVLSVGSEGLVRPQAVVSPEKTAAKVVPPTQAEVTIFCAHCSEPFAGQKFQPPLCARCRQAGHRGDVRACGICTDGTAL